MSIQDEYENIEFKQSLTERHEAVISLAAFATAKGGEVRFGIAPDGSRKGIELGRTALEDLANYTKANTDPPLFPSIEVDGDPKNAVMIVRIEESPIKPVWAFGTPYKRVGRTNQKISREETERLFDATRGMSWDALPCNSLKMEHIDRGVVEAYLRRAQQDTGLATDTVLENLNFRTGDALINGAALLFTAKPQRWITGSQVKCARFKGTASVDFLDEQTLDGDVISQIDRATAFVARNTRQAIRITGKPERDVIGEYPETAVREALNNAVCHRDYASAGTVQVRIYDDRLEVWNPGALPKGMDIASLYGPHPSYPRNKRLADAFHRAHLIEQWGTGTLRIVGAYDVLGGKRPEFEEKSGAFMIRMFPILEAPVGSEDARQTKALQYALEHDGISRSEYVELCTVSPRQAARDLEQMVEDGLLVPTGGGRSTRYKANPSV